MCYNLQELEQELLCWCKHRLVTMAQHYFLYIHANEFTYFRDQLASVEIQFENNLLPYIELHIKSLMTSNKFVFIQKSNTYVHVFQNTMPKQIRF